MKQIYDEIGKQFIRCDIHGNAMHGVYAESSPMEFHIPEEVTSHLNWSIYDAFDTLQAMYAHPDSEAYECFDGAVYSKKTQTLLYIPLGKTTLHIPGHIRYIAQQVLARRNLETITVDADNPHLRVVDGMLYDAEMKTLYFVPPCCEVLSIVETVTHIDRAVLLRSYASIEVAEGNTAFWASGDWLMKGRSVVSCRTDNGRLHIPAEVRPHFLTDAENEWRLWNLREVTVSEDHPDCCGIDGIVYTKDRTMLLYLPAYVQQAVFPNELKSLEGVHFDKCPALRMISVHVDTQFTAHDLEKLHEDCRIEVRLDDETAVSLPRIDSYEMAACIRFLKSGEAEVKPGTEQFFADCFLRNRNPSAAFAHVMHLSAWQIMKCIVEQNDLARMQALLNDGRLLTKKNRKRARALAEERGLAEMQALLNG